MTTVKNDYMAIINSLFQDSKVSLRELKHKVRVVIIDGSQNGQ